MHVMCVHGNLAPTSADVILAGDTGRIENVGVQRDDASLQFKVLVPNNSWCSEEQIFLPWDRCGNADCRFWCTELRSRQLSICFRNSLLVSGCLIDHQFWWSFTLSSRNLGKVLVWLNDQGIGLTFPAGNRSSCCAKPLYQRWDPRNLLSSGYLDLLFQGVERSWRKAGHSPPSGAEVVNEGAVLPLSCLSTFHSA